MNKLVLTVLLSVSVQVLSRNVGEVIKERRSLLDSDQNLMLGHDITLTDNEEKVNELLMCLKKEVLDFGFRNPSLFNISQHFFHYKDVVSKSRLFQILHEMPKGALLHAHDTGVLDTDYVMNVTYNDDLYVCFHEDNVNFLFSQMEPDVPCQTRWLLMRDARYSSGNVEKFDADLRKHFTIVIDNPEEVYTDVNAVWTQFQNYFIKTSGLFTYRPVWKSYFYDTLKALLDENIMFLEIRSVLPDLYDLEGNTYNAVDTAKAYYEVVTDFKKDHADFYGAKLIYAPLRKASQEKISEYLKIARQIKRELPDFFAGFDLVGQEDLGNALSDFLPQLTEAANEFDLYLHAAETNWNGMTDENLYDAIALGAKRLGHAYGLTKHPKLMEEVKTRNIAIEVNVISNQVLNLVHDLRNHPLATFLANGMPVVISSDDPGVWGASVATHDWYVTFVGVACRHADVRLLKKLAINSIVYSSVAHKEAVLHEFEIRWTKFIDNFLKDPPVCNCE